METIHEKYQYLFLKIRSNLQQKPFKIIVKLRCLLHDHFDEKFEWLFCFIFLVHIASVIIFLPWHMKKSMWK